MKTPVVPSRRRTYGALRPVAMAAVLLVVLVLAVLAASLLTRESGPTLTIDTPTGGTIFASGIRCGTQGADCTTTGTPGEVIGLRVEADETYSFGGYTGDCAPGGHVMMDGPHACGARFDRVSGPGSEPGEPSVSGRHWPLTITPPQNGTIVTLEGHECGTTGTVCAKDVPEGHIVRLDVMANEGYRVQSYTGDCVQDGTANMIAPRTCGAVLVKGDGPSLVSNPPAKPPPPGNPPNVPRAASDAKPRDGSPSALVAVPSSPAPTANAGDARDTTRQADPGAARSDARLEGDRKLAEEIARKDIAAVLSAYRAAYARMDIVGMTRVQPGVDARRFELQFKDLKSVKYTFGGEPTIEDLDVERGQARAIVDVKTENEFKAGGKQKPLESGATFLLKRIRETEAWEIIQITYKPK